MKLADLNYTYDPTNIDKLKTDISKSLDLSTYIEATPEIMVNDLNSMVDYFKDNFKTNLTEFATGIKKYFDNQAELLKEDVEKNLALNSNTTYDIHVTESNHATDADKLNNYSFEELISYIVSNYILPSTVANSLKFDGHTYKDMSKDIKENVKVDNASNADKLNNMNYDAIKNDILSNVKTQGTDYDGIKDKVENTWVSYKSKDTNNFAGDDKNTWTSSIIPKIKVNHAVDADKLDGYSYNDLKSKMSNDVDTKINNLNNNSSFKNMIKGIKVDNASNADTANNAKKFNNYDFDDYNSYIKKHIKVNDASNADTLGNLNTNDWKSYIKNQVNDLQKDLTQGNVIPKKASEVEEINGVATSNYDTHINNLIDDKLNNYKNNTDAKKFNGYTFDEYNAYIKKNIKVDNASNADTAASAANSNNSLKLNGHTYNEVLSDATKSTLHQIDQNPLDKINILLNNEKEFKYNSTLLSALLYFNPQKNTIPLLDVSDIHSGFKKQEISYNDSGLISEVKYYTSDDVMEFNDGNKPVDGAYINQREKYSYDKKNNIDKIDYELYLPVDVISNDKKYTKITYSKTFNYDNGILTSIDVSDQDVEETNDLPTS